jgi:hypothetical protein
MSAFLGPRSPVQHWSRRYGIRALQEFLDEADHLLVPRAALGLVGLADHDLLDLVELVDAVEARGVLARGAGFAAEAGADGDVLQGQEASSRISSMWMPMRPTSPVPVRKRS